MEPEKLGGNNEDVEINSEADDVSEALKKMAEELEGAPKVELNEAEHEMIFNGDLDDVEVQELMKEKGLKLNSGFVEVLIDGEKKLMSTAEDDLGTIEEYKKAA